jgi:hypothetical protein
MKQQRENADKHKTKKIKQNWIKSQIAKNQSKDTQWQSRKQRFLRLSKNHKTKFFFLIFSINYQLRKNRLRVRGPNLLTMQS